MHPRKFLKKKISLAILVLWAIATLTFATVPSLAQTSTQAEPPAVEYLKFQVPTDRQAQFIEQDAAIWTPVLSSYPGFQRKEIWTSDRPDELVIVVHWSSFAQWQAIPKEVLDRTTQQFNQAVGAEYMPEVTAFQIAWRSSTNP